MGGHASCAGADDDDIKAIHIIASHMSWVLRGPIEGAYHDGSVDKQVERLGVKSGL
jgi:hypothetical protein